MTNYFNNLLQLEHIEQLFDCRRFIDVDSEILYSESRLHNSINLVDSFIYIKRQELYKRSLATNAVLYKLEQENELLLLFAIMPFNIEEKKFILEYVANVTKKIDLNYVSLDPGTSIPDSIHNLAFTDELTGLFNRRYINQMLPVSITTCANEKLPLSIIFADLDYFKDINDSYGHVAGDYLLNTFATELQRSVRQTTDWVARYGGDEFLLCLVGSNAKKAKLIAEQIRHNTEKKSFIYNGSVIKTTCSLGIYTIRNFETYPSCDFIISELDKKLYKAKKSGRNSVG